MALAEPFSAYYVRFSSSEQVFLLAAYPVCRDNEEYTEVFRQSELAPLELRLPNWPVEFAIQLIPFHSNPTRSYGQTSNETAAGKDQKQTQG